LTKATSWLHCWYSFSSKFTLWSCEFNCPPFTTFTVCQNKWPNISTNLKSILVLYIEWKQCNNIINFFVLRFRKYYTMNHLSWRHLPLFVYITISGRRKLKFDRNVDISDVNWCLLSWEYRRSFALKSLTFHWRILTVSGRVRALRNAKYFDVEWTHS
jgi:hypothetical protein